MKKFLAIYCQFKNESHVINEWINHYLNEGVDDIYLVDNGSNDNYQILPQFKNHVSLEIDPERHAQIKIGQRYLHHLQNKYEWLIVADMDEFIFTTSYTSIKSYLEFVSKTFPKIKCIGIPWTMFGSSHHQKQPESVIHNFLFRDHINTSFPEGRFQKSIFKPQYYDTFYPHYPMSKKHPRYNDPPYITLNFYSEHLRDLQTVFHPSELQCNHYAVQSKAFFENVKMTRKDVHSPMSDHVRDWNYFQKYDKNNKKDERLSKKRSIDQRPFSIFTKKILVLQYDNRTLTPETKKLTEINKNYSKKHNYEYIFVTNDYKLPPYWIKVHLVRTFLETGYFQGILWLDTDACVYNDEIKLESLIQHDKSFYYAGDTYNRPSKFNAGVFFVMGDKIGHDIMSSWMNQYDTIISRKWKNKWEENKNQWMTNKKWAGITYEQGSFAKNILPKYKKHVFQHNWEFFQSWYPKTNFLKNRKKIFILHFSHKKKKFIPDFLKTL